jgi:hypothetical protein
VKQLLHLLWCGEGEWYDTYMAAMLEMFGICHPDESQELKLQVQCADLLLFRWYGHGGAHGSEKVFGIDGT